MIRKVTVPACKPAQKILDSYKKNAFNKNELVRIKLAEELCQDWKNNKIKLPLLAIPEAQDYWYLVQLYSMDRHVHNDRKPYLFNWRLSENLYIENYYGSLTKLLLEEYREKITSPITRQQVDFLILNFQEKILQKLKFNTHLYKISHIPFDIHIRLLSNKNWKIQRNNIFFDGYRLRTDGKLMSLFGKETFVDSLWSDLPNKTIFPLLIIIRKDYGY